jgi:hypothetical protein
MNARHLQYDSVEAWISGENVPSKFVSLSDPILREKYITQYGELRRHLFAKHLATLSRVDQDKFQAGKHPSQSHSFSEDAEPYCHLLDEHLRSRGIFADEIELGWYHTDRIVLTVYLDESNVGYADGKAPWLFKGFEVLYCPPKQSRKTEA